jgi:RNA polymerase sigma factor (sigma-70 family)
MTALGAIRRLRGEPPTRSRAARGDFAAVYESHQQALYRYCRSILRHEHDAQDALQNTMARAFAALEGEERDFEVRPWLFRIAHNEAISILRRRRETDELDDSAQDVGDLEDHVASREELRLLRLDLDDLPERQRAALVLRELSGFSHAEIGVVLDLSPSAVKQTIFEARNALFVCQEGREMDCDAVRRMLSDGDGRVLRGRGVRAHLRTCRGCRRFRGELERRPQALRMLAPPLPVGAGAALLAQIFGTGTAVKLLACLAIAGTSATVAVEMRDTRPVVQRREPAPQRAVKTAAAPAPIVRTAAPQPVAAAPVARAAAPHPRSASVKQRPAKPKHAKAHRHAAKRAHEHPVVAVNVAAPPRPAKPPKPPTAMKAPKPAKGNGHALKAAKPKHSKPVTRPIPTVAALTEPRHVPPGQAREKPCHGNGHKSC